MDAPLTMNDPDVDPIQRSISGLDTNGNTQKSEPENRVEVGGGSSNNGDVSSKSSKNGRNSSNSVLVKRDRPTRACTTRVPKYVDPPVVERRFRGPKREKVEKEVVVEEERFSEEENEGVGECSSVSTKVVTSLVNVPSLEQIPRWKLRSMWELASILNFLHVFRPLLNINVDFSSEELESALLNPNGTLSDVHVPLLKSIPPVTRMAWGGDTWITVLCRKMRDWWHWVADGDLPLVASQGAEIETYKHLDPAVRVIILKAVCDIRVEQDDIRSYIENSIKHSVPLSAFRKERVGGDSHGISYWYEGDEEIGHRLCREIRKVEKKVETKKKIKGSHALPSTLYEWETVATNLDEFLDVSEKLFSSSNRTEVSLGRKLKNDMIPEIERIHKKKEKLLRKQQRQALLLDNFVNMDGLGAGRSLRDRKPVTYTFDDFDRSINEAIKVTKRKQPSPEPGVRREFTRSASANGRWNGSEHSSMHASFSPYSPADYADEMDEDQEDQMSEPLDRSTRTRQRSQRYSGKEFIGELSDNDEYIDSDDDIVGEAVYEDGYLKQRKLKKKITSSSEGEGEGEGEGDEEYHFSDENGEDDMEEEPDDDEDSLSGSEDSFSDSDGPRPRRRFKELKGPTRSRRESRMRNNDDMDGLRRSKRSTRTQINYQQYEYSESESESVKRRKTNPSEPDPYNNATESHDSEEGNVEEYGDIVSDPSEPEPEPETEPEAVDKEESRLSTKSESPRRFLDLNELAPGSGFDDGPSVLVKDDDDVKPE